MKSDIQREMAILIIHNNDFPSVNGESAVDGSSESEEPPSCSASPEAGFDESYLGVLARASIVGVAKAVKESLNELGFLNVDVAPVNCLDEISNKLKSKKYDLVFNLCESLDGDSHMEIAIAKLLESFNIPFTGNSSHTLKIALSKFDCAKVLNDNGVSIPDTFVASSLRELDGFRFSKHAYIVKPNDQDGSTGINSSSVVHNKGELVKQVDILLHQYHSSALIQEYIAGREINVAILGGRSNEIINCTEIDFSGLDEKLPKILSYSAKWHTDSEEYKKTVSVCPEISSELRKRLYQETKKVMRAMKFSGYGRVDFRVNHVGEPYVIDVNPNCDLDPVAGLANAARYSGMTYTNLVGNILEIALENFENNKKQTNYLSKRKDARDRVAVGIFSSVREGLEGLSV